MGLRAVGRVFRPTKYVGLLIVAVLVPAVSFGLAQPGAALNNPKMGALTDAFPGTSLNSALWTSYGTVALAEGVVTLTDAGNTAQYSGIKSLALYDLTDSQLEAQLVSAGTQATSAQAAARPSMFL